MPATFLSMGQGPKLLLEVEKGIVETLKQMETA
jgi:proteasome assembly chaperone 4